MNPRVENLTHLFIKAQDSDYVPVSSSSTEYHTIMTFTVDEMEEFMQLAERWGCKIELDMPHERIFVEKKK